MTTTTVTHGADSPQRRGLVPYAEFARLLASNDLRDDPSFAVRVLRESVLQAETLTAQDDIDAFHCEPPRTGHPGWDALLAGVAVFTGAGRVSPGVLQWTLSADRRVPELFDPLDTGKYRLLEMFRTPAAIREHNVILAAGNLEGV